MIEMIIVGVVCLAVGIGGTKWYYTKASAEDKAKLHDLEDRMKRQGIILRE
jgi:hypothetical protein